MAKSKSKSETNRVRQIWKLLEEDVFDVPSGDDTFNFYRDVDPEVDLPEGAEIRRENLKQYLEQVCEPPTTLVVGQSPNWRAGRFTGVPFTSQAQLLRPDFPVKGRRSSRGPNPLSEKTATLIWESFLPYHPELFFWHAFPLHAHRLGARPTDRTPTRREMREFAPVLEEIHGILEPERVVAVGRSGQTALDDLEIEYAYLKHPAYGGERAFRRGVRDALEPDEDE